MSDYPKTLVEIRSKFIERLLFIGISSDLAEYYAHTLTEVLRVEFGGQQTYWAKGDQYELSKRDKEIFTKFNGANYRELAKQYNVSVQWVYKIIAHQRKKDCIDRQHDLFGETELPPRRLI